VTTQGCALFGATYLKRQVPQPGNTATGTDSFCTAAETIELVLATAILELMLWPQTRNKQKDTALMVIEWLKIPVPPDRQPDYLRHDAEIWTKTLSEQAGFVGKEVWRDASDPGILHLVIRWESLSAWKSVPRPVLDDADARFSSAINTTYAVADCLTYDILSPVSA
jgi:uncharacterized protein (TIGR03792 family)